MEIMIVKSKIKHKSKTVLGMIGNLVLDFMFYYITAYTTRYAIHVTSALGTTKKVHYTSLEEVRIKSFMTNSLQQ